MSKTFIRHFVNEMDESMVQRCIFCGEVISDYQNVMWLGDLPPKGFAAGEVFEFPGNPTITSTTIGDDENFIKCK